MDVNEKLARAVGHAVIRAAQLEEVLVLLAYECLRDRHENRSKTSGQSGEGLVRLLREADQQDLAAAYKELAEQRNSVVHGTWRGNADRMVSERLKPRAPSLGEVTRVEWTFDELEELSLELEQAADLATKRLFNRVELPEDGNLVIGGSRVV